MRRALWLFALLLAGCLDFDSLGAEARCRNDAGPCDGGAIVPSGDAGTSDAGTSDAGTSDAGMGDAGMGDAGMSDAGTDDGGSDAGSDAGPVAEAITLVTSTLSVSENLDPATMSRRPGAVVAADGGRVLFFAEFTRTVNIPNFPPIGYPSGYVFLVDPTPPHYVQLDGGLGGRAPYSVFQYVQSTRGPVVVRGGLATYTLEERLVDGGRAPEPDGGFAQDGGFGQYGVRDAFYSVSLSTLNATYGGEVLERPLAASPLKLNGMVRDAYVGATGGASGLIYPARGPLARVNGAAVTSCGGPALDAVVTLDAMDDRLVTLMRCAPIGNLIVASFGPLLAPSTTLASNADGARMAIASEDVPGRAPFVAWSTTSEVRLARLSHDGVAVALEAVVTKPGSTARVAAMAVDDTNGPVVVLELPASTGSVDLVGLPNPVLATESLLVVAAFDRELRLRWAGKVQSTTRLVSNSAAISAGRLVLELQCPDATTASPIGAPCGNATMSTVNWLLRSDGRPP